MTLLRSNPKIDLAREFILNTRANIFLTGKAGTGKTTLLRSVIASLNKRAVIAAPTGVAALNAGGVTLHSLFQLPFGIHIPGSKFVSRRISRRKLALIRSIEMLVIDEVSMVRSDMLDAIDQTLRTVRRSMQPFAGVQLLLIGDIQQLAPICRDEEWELLKEHYSTPYFFDSKALALAPYVTIEFDEIFRQSDSHFTEILNAVRDNRLTDETLAQLNRRYIPEFEPDESDDYITLTTHNNSAFGINSRKLGAIAAPSHYFDAKISGEFMESAYPNDTRLELKVGAQVLFIKNDISPEKRYYNGMIGRVVSIDSTGVVVSPKSGFGDIRVERVVWESVEYSVNKESGEMEQSVKGSFSQIPLKCAWAITIHKSQGLSFDRAIIDASSAFTHGQVYVALSRCRSLEGMVLRAPISRGAIISETSVDNYTDFVSRNQPTNEVLDAYKRDYYSAVLCEIFDFGRLQRELWELMSEMSGAVAKSYPKLMATLIDQLSLFDREVAKVSESFRKQIQGAIYGNENYAEDEYIRGRLRSAAEYFEPRLEPFVTIVKQIGSVEIDSNETRRRVVERTGGVGSMLKLVMESLKLCRSGFSVSEFQARKAKLLALNALEEEGERRTKRESPPKGERRKMEDVSDVIHKELYDTLVEWRLEEAREMKRPAYNVLTNRTLMQIQGNLPRSVEDLKRIAGMGEVKMRRYADQILEIVNEYCFSNNV